MGYRSIIRLPGAAAFLLLCAQANAQSATLSGTVVDAASGQPIPFAVVEIPARHLGVQATEQGTFVLELPATLASADSLRATSLGFVPRVLALPKTAACRLQLTALAVPLSEVVVRPSTTRPVLLGNVEDGNKFGFGGGAIMSAERSSGWQVARKFSEAPAGTILSVRFYVKPNPHCGKASVKAPFRVRVYAADGPNGSPGTDLLTTSVFTAATTKGWHEVNLATYQITMPPGGFFVAMEWLFTTPEFGCDYAYYTAAKEKIASHYYGQHLGGYLGFNQPTAWYLSAGYPWQIFRPVPHFVNMGNQSAAIQAVIQPN